MGSRSLILLGATVSKSYRLPILRTKSRAQTLLPVISTSSIVRSLDCNYSLLTSGKSFGLRNVRMSTLSFAHQMNCQRMFRIGLCKLSMKQYSLLCHQTMSSYRNQHLLSWSCYFLNDTTPWCHHTQMSFKQHKSTAACNFISASNLISTDSLLFNPVSSHPLIFTQLRGLRGFPSNRTDKQTLDKVSRRNTEVTRTEVEMHADQKTNAPEAVSSEPEAPVKLTLYQRFKKTYKEHGKVLVAVHALTSAVWLGSFYTLVRCGFDIVPYLESWNFSETMISPFRSGGLGDLALAYLLYKLATPARYTVTIGGTNLAIKYLRKGGKIPVVPKEDSIRSLYREGKEDLKRRSNVRIKRLRKRNKNKE